MNKIIVTRKKVVIILINIKSMYYNHFSIREIFTNCSDKEILDCVKLNFAESLFCLFQFLDNFRDYIESPITINSTYRDTPHNQRVGGVTTSQHLLGQAVDFTTKQMPISTTAYKLRQFVKVSALSHFVGQIIIYNNFIHIGLRTKVHKNLTIYDKRTSKQTN